MIYLTLRPLRGVSNMDDSLASFNGLSLSPVSMQELSSSVGVLSAGLVQVQTEIGYIRRIKTLSSIDAFVRVMEVSSIKDDVQERSINLYP